jgi:hypothetical protein
MKFKFLFGTNQPIGSYASIFIDNFLTTNNTLLDIIGKRGGDCQFSSRFVGR